MSIIFSSALIAIALSGCAVRAAKQSAAPIARVAPLAVSQVALPRFPVAAYKTRGAYPTVFLNGKPLKRVDAGVRAAAIRMERQQAPSYWHAVRMYLRGGGIITKGGTFQLDQALERLSASTRVVSVIAPVYACTPGSSDCTVGFSATVRVPSGRRVELRDLLAGPQPKHSLADVSRIVKRHVLATNHCVRSTRWWAVGGTGFSPSWRHYQFFALAPGGLTFGFPKGQVAAYECGDLFVTTPYVQVRPYLSKLGRWLVDGVRRPVYGDEQPSGRR